MPAARFAALLLFAVAGSGSPGPNNTLLLASGARFGFVPTLRHVGGTAMGIGALILVVAAGVGAVFEAVPAARLTLKLVGSAYLLYLAFRLAGDAAVEDATITRPLTVREAATFQFVNPKGWVFAVALVAAFLPPGMPAPVGGIATAAIVAVVVATTATVWALGGAGLRGVLRSERSRRRLTVALAALMAVSVVFLWI
jgi:threonine/homoserine/homoserine lactone efflux protein